MTDAFELCRRLLDRDPTEMELDEVSLALVLETDLDTRRFALDDVSPATVAEPEALRLLLDLFLSRFSSILPNAELSDIFLEAEVLALLRRDRGLNNSPPTEAEPETYDEDDLERLG